MSIHMTSFSVYKLRMCAGIKTDALPATKNTVWVLVHFSDYLREEKRGSTLRRKEPLVPCSLKKCFGFPSETCTSLSRNGALAGAVHKVSSAQRAFLSYALRSGWLSAFTPPFHFSRHGEAQKLTCPWHGKKEANGQRPQNSSQGNSWLIPLKREAPPKRKAKPDTTPSGSPRSLLRGKTSDEPAEKPVQADPDATLSPTGEASGAP